MSDHYINSRKKLFPTPESCGWLTNTYPWPYSDPRFADWEEDDRGKTYTLISDQAGFVIRRSTSYVAWKIYELTGRWPTERGSDGEIFHAKYWQKFLGLNGFTKFVARPEPGKHYVGIIPDEGEFGQVVWFEGMTDATKPGMGPGYAISTYWNFEYVTDTRYDVTKAIWVEIEVPAK